MRFRRLQSWWLTGPVSTRLPLLIFDGDCAFCTSSVEFLRRWVDRAGRYAIEPWQRVDPSAYGLTAADCMDAAQFIDADGAVHAGHRAIAFERFRALVGFDAEAQVGAAQHGVRCAMMHPHEVAQFRKLAELFGRGHAHPAAGLTAGDFERLVDKAHGANEWR